MMTTQQLADIAKFTEDLSPKDKKKFHFFFERRKKRTTPAVLLALFLGGLGAHHFYLGYPVSAVIYIAFCWTFIPSLIAVIEAVVMPWTVKSKNDKIATEIIQEMEIFN